MARYLITSALPYINGVKHLGNLAGSMLPADVHARFRRMQGHEVLFICATDEHGTPAELAAAELGVSPRAYCDQFHDIQRKAGEGFGLSFDWFGRTSNPPNHRLTQHLAEALEGNRLLEERTTRQVYSNADKRFLPDRYVEGTCPFCFYENARGDQCDNCGALLDPVQLKNPRSKISGSSDVELRDTAHLFLLQSKMQEQIRAWVDRAEGWPSLARSIAYKWLDEGLIDRSITRDLAWGVKVTKDGAPRQGFDDKVFYVWFDAPIGYIGATVEWAEGKGGNWERWWRTDKGAADVTYVQFMGKDNVAFHTVSFPVTIIGSGEPWKLVDRLKAFNWVTWYGDKFSTSQRRGVFMDQALELLPGDYWRWYLMANAPESSDAAFTWEQFKDTINADLANVLGNFVNRIMKFAETKMGGVVPMEGEPGPLENELYEDLEERLARISDFHDQMEFRKAAAETRSLWVRGNEYLQLAAPWTALKTDPVRAAMVVRTGLNLCALFAATAFPFIPESAQAIRDGLGLKGDPAWPLGAKLFELVSPGAPIAVPPVLFRKIEDADVAAWSERFGGG
ncbi:MAG: methionine--tRNA ligase [Alphaproteobacteria bacterium]|nr:methionine--tRNA ligase [Alphaproteobacteria bacterium]